MNKEIKISKKEKEIYEELLLRGEDWKNSPDRGMNTFIIWDVMLTEKENPKLWLWITQIKTFLNLRTIFFSFIVVKLFILFLLLLLT